MQRRELPAPEVTIDGARERAGTQLGYAGAYSVTLSTTLPALGLELHSTYLGHEQTPTLAGHLALAPRDRRVRHLVHDPGALPVAGGPGSQPGARGRGALLLDHLAELRTHISAVTGAQDVRVDVTDAALQQLQQYQQNWITYRSTCERLKHEKFLFAAHAGPYATSDPQALLAERVESLVSQEHAAWVYQRKESARQPDDSQ